MAEEGLEEETWVKDRKKLIDKLKSIREDVDNLRITNIDDAKEEIDEVVFNIDKLIEDEGIN